MQKCASLRIYVFLHTDLVLAHFSPGATENGYMPVVLGDGTFAIYSLALGNAIFNNREIASLYPLNVALVRVCYVCSFAALVA